MIHRASAIGNLGEAVAERRLEPGPERAWQAAANEPDRERKRRSVTDAEVGQSIARMQISAGERQALSCGRDADLECEPLLKHEDRGSPADADRLDAAAQVSDEHLDLRHQRARSRQGGPVGAVDVAAAR